MPNLANAETPTASNMAWGIMTRAARDAAYNNSQAVSDSAQIVNRWVAASATFRSQRSKQLDVPYGPGERNKWDLFPADNPAAPCLVFIHGGGIVNLTEPGHLFAARSVRAKQHSRRAKDLPTRAAARPTERAYHGRLS